VNEAGEKIGNVTSGTMLPDSKKGIGMGYVQTAYSKAGSKIFIAIRNKNLEAVVVK
jgi:aminomethyltransferase